MQGNLVAACRNHLIDLFRKAEKDMRLMSALTESAMAQFQDESGKNAEQVVTEQWQLLQKAIANLHL